MYVCVCVYIYIYIYNNSIWNLKSSNNVAVNVFVVIFGIVAKQKYEYYINITGLVHLKIM